MRRTLVFFGLIILLGGLASIVIGSIRNTRLELLNNSTASWEISGNLSKGSTYVLDIMSSYVWRDDYTAGGYTTPQAVDVVMVSPDEGRTKLQAFFLAQLPSTQGYKSTFPSLIHVEYKSVDSESLDVDESYPQVRFTTKQGGNYNASIISETLNWTRGPPREMIFYRVVEDQTSSKVFLQGGGAVCLLTGVVISVWGVRTTKRFRVKARKRAKK